MVGLKKITPCRASCIGLGQLYWTRTTDIRKAYRTDSDWIYQKIIKKELAKSFYWKEQRDHYQNLI